MPVIWFLVAQYSSSFIYVIRGHSIWIILVRIPQLHIFFNYLAKPIVFSLFIWMYCSYSLFFFCMWIYIFSRTMIHLP